MQPNNRAFTLIELLVVIAIIGLLSSIVLASLNTARAKGYDAQRVSNLRNVQQALELYASDHNGQYPSTGGAWYSTCSGWTVTTQNNAIPGLVPTYISQLPIDPSVNTAANTCCYMYNSAAVDYKYIDYYCSVSQACYGSTVNPSFADPARPGMDCAVYTPGESSW